MISMIKDNNKANFWSFFGINAILLIPIYFVMIIIGVFLAIIFTDSSDTAANL